MKRVLVAATMLGMFAGVPALAQTVGPAETVVIESEQRTVIRDFVVKERVAPVTVKERIAVGARLPADVELRTVPSTWGPKLSKYRYIYSGNQVYLVEPSNRTVVQIIERSRNPKPRRRAHHAAPFSLSANIRSKNAAREKII